MTEAHERHDGADHIWQQRRKYLYLRGLEEIEYACVCGATMVKIRRSRDGDPDDGS